MAHEKEKSPTRGEGDNNRPKAYSQNRKRRKGLIKGINLNKNGGMASE